MLVVHYQHLTLAVYVHSITIGVRVHNNVYHQTMCHVPSSYPILTIVHNGLPLTTLHVQHVHLFTIGALLQAHVLILQQVAQLPSHRYSNAQSL